MLKAQIIPVTEFAQNCSVIWCDQTMEAAFIDPGGDRDVLMQVVKEHNLNLKQILVTHAHIDHVGAVADIAEFEKLPIIGPNEDDIFWINQLPMQSQMFGFPPARTFEPKTWLKDGDEVTVGNETLTCVHCPGHTPGHIVFIHDKQRLAFVGDVLFKGSIGRTDFPKGNHGDLIHAITEKLLPHGDDIVFVPGHGPTSTFGEERLNNPYLR